MLALSFKSLEIAPKGVFHNWTSLMCSRSSWLFIVLFIANKRTRILIELLVFSLLKRILLLIASRPFFGSNFLFYGFLRWISVRLFSFSAYSVIKLLIFTISMYVFFAIFYIAFSAILEGWGGAILAIFLFFLRIFDWFCVIYEKNLEFFFFRDKISILSNYIVKALAWRGFWWRPPPGLRTPLADPQVRALCQDRSDHTD
jgi:hypothetical protein